MHGTPRGGIAGSVFPAPLINSWPSLVNVGVVTCARARHKKSWTKRDVD